MIDIFNDDVIFVFVLVIKVVFLLLKGKLMYFFMLVGYKKYFIVNDIIEFIYN